MGLHALAVLLATLLVHAVPARKGSINSFAGPYIAYGERFYNCEGMEGNMLWNMYVRATHFNPHKPTVPQNVTGNVTGTLVPLDDTAWVRGKEMVILTNTATTRLGSPATSLSEAIGWNLLCTHLAFRHYGAVTQAFDGVTVAKMQAFLDKRNNNQWKDNFFVFKFPDKACSMVRAQAPDIYRVLFRTTKTDGPCVQPPSVYIFNNEPVRWVFPNVPVLPYGAYRIRIKFGKAQKMYSCLAVDCYVIPRAE